MAQLAVPGVESIGGIEVPSVDILQPIFHGERAEILMKGVGHMEGTHLPVGGIGNTTVLSGHTAVPGKKFFDNLHYVKVGELVLLRVAGETLAYKVTDIEVLKPEDTEVLYPVEGRDRLVLVTCTPYSVNTHRLVVQAERTEYVESGDVADVGGLSTASLWWVLPLVASVGAVVAVTVVVYRRV